MSISILPHDIVVGLPIEKNESVQDKKYKGVCRKKEDLKSQVKLIENLFRVAAQIAF